MVVHHVLHCACLLVAGIFWLQAEEWKEFSYKHFQEIRAEVSKSEQLTLQLAIIQQVVQQQQEYIMFLEKNITQKRIAGQ